MSLQSPIHLGVFVGAFGLRLLLTLGSPAWAEPPRGPSVVGHRGLMQNAPENTLAAFSACLKSRVGFEFDVRRTKDGKLVCLHDATLDRTTNGRGPLVEQTFAELRKLDAGSWFDRAFAEERVPAVAEILAMVTEMPRGSLVAVDLKASGDGLENAIIERAAKLEILDRLLFIGLTIESPEIRALLKKANRHAQTAQLAKSPEQIAPILADADSDWVYVRFVPTGEQAASIHQAGKRIFIAGPLVAGEETANWQAAADAGVDAILTDYPLELAKRLRGK